MDQVSTKTGLTRYAMAKSLNVHQGFMSRVYTGRDPIPPALAARLAALAGMDARRAAMEALVSQEKSHERQCDLAQALGLPVPPPPEEDVTGLPFKTAEQWQQHR
jgi:hypothetical protein